MVECRNCRGTFKTPPEAMGPAVPIGRCRSSSDSIGRGGGRIGSLRLYAEFRASPPVGAVGSGSARSAGRVARGVPVPRLRREVHRAWRRRTRASCGPGRRGESWFGPRDRRALPVRPRLRHLHRCHVRRRRGGVGRRPHDGGTGSRRLVARRGGGGHVAPRASLPSGDLRSDDGGIPDRHDAQPALHQPLAQVDGRPSSL